MDIPIFLSLPAWWLALFGAALSLTLPTLLARLSPLLLAACLLGWLAALAVMAGVAGMSGALAGAAVSIAVGVAAFLLSLFLAGIGDLARKQRYGSG